MILKQAEYINKHGKNKVVPYYLYVLLYTNMFYNNLDENKRVQKFRKLSPKPPYRLSVRLAFNQTGRPRRSRGRPPSPSFRRTGGGAGQPGGWGEGAVTPAGHSKHTHLLSPPATTLRASPGRWRYYLPA